MTTFKKIFQKRWVKVCSSLCVFILILYLAIPFGVKYALSDWLKKNGADYAYIEHFRYNPFTSKIIVEGVEVEKNGVSLLSNSRVALDFSLISLFKQDIHLQKAEYKDLHINLEKYEDGRWRFASYTTGEQEKTSVVTEEKTVSSWAVLADTVALSDCSVTLKMTDLEIQLDIDQAELSRFTTRRGQPAGSFTFEGRINQAPVTLQLDKIQVFPHLQVEGGITLSKFDLNYLALLLENQLDPFKGTASLDGSILLDISDEQGTRVSYDGGLLFTQPALGNAVFFTQAKQLGWKGTVQYSTAIEGPIEIETDGLLFTDEHLLKLPQSELTMQESSIKYAGKTSVAITDDISIKHLGTLSIEGYKSIISGLVIAEDSLEWKGAVSFNTSSSEGGLLVDSNGSLALGEYSVGSNDGSLPVTTSGENIDWQGNVSFRRKDLADEESLYLKGTLTGVNLQTVILESDLYLSQEQLQVVTDSNILLTGSTSIHGESGLFLDNFQLIDSKQKTPLLTLESLDMDGVIGSGSSDLSVKQIAVDYLAVSVPGSMPLQIEIPKIDFRNLQIADFKSFQIQAVDIKKPLVTSIQNKATLIAFDTFTAKNIQADTSAAGQAEAIQFDNLRFLPGDNKQQPDVLSLGRINVSDLGWNNEKGLSGKAITISDLAAAFIRGKEGALNLNSQLDAMKVPSVASGKTVAVVETNQESSPAPVNIQKIAMAGENKLYFEDQSLAVPYKTDLTISKFQITNLNSTQPEQKSLFELIGELEKRAPLEITGHISPFLDQLAIKLKLKLKNYPLSSLSPYTVQSVGTKLASGQLKIKTRMELAGDTLDMQNTVVLKKLTTETLSKELADELDNQLPISLNTALGMLRDNEDNISLEIPLQGKLTDLDVGISDVLITALGKAIVPAASGYLMYALGPYGALAYVGLKVGEKILQVNLPPIHFTPGNITISEEHTKYLKRVAKILHDRPEVDLQICPTVASWELMSEDEVAAIDAQHIDVNENDTEQLLQLGQDRAEEVKNHLMSSYSVKEDRLLICKTKIDTEKKVIPSVLLNL